MAARGCQGLLPADQPVRGVVEFVEVAGRTALRPGCGQVNRRTWSTMATSEPAARSPLIRLGGVPKVYGTGPAAVHALRGVDLCIDEGEFVAVMGSSGSGTSTCLNIIGCLDTPTDGTYHYCPWSIATCPPASGTTGRAGG